MKLAASHVDLIRAANLDVESVVRREAENDALFERHRDLWFTVPEDFDHPAHYRLAFGDLPRGQGFLDIGSGPNGVFLESVVGERFAPPRLGIDVGEVFDADRHPGWQSRIMDGSDILETFGPLSFDMVQCCEALEHTTNERAIDIARQMSMVARRYCFITSCGVLHHLGPLNADAVKLRPTLAYQGQPNIESLLKLGYTVRLNGGYQILAWLTKL